MLFEPSVVQKLAHAHVLVPKGGLPRSTWIEAAWKQEASAGTNRALLAATDDLVTEMRDGLAGASSVTSSSAAEESLGAL